MWNLAPADATGSFSSSSLPAAARSCTAASAVNTLGSSPRRSTSSFNACTTADNCGGESVAASSKIADTGVGTCTRCRRAGCLPVPEVVGQYVAVRGSSPRWCPRAEPHAPPLPRTGRPCPAARRARPAPATGRSHPAGPGPRSAVSHGPPSAAQPGPSAAPPPRSRSTRPVRRGPRRPPARPSRAAGLRLMRPRPGPAPDPPAGPSASAGRPHAPPASARAGRWAS